MSAGERKPWWQDLEDMRARRGMTISDIVEVTWANGPGVFHTTARDVLKGENLDELTLGDLGLIASALGCPLWGVTVLIPSVMDTPDGPVCWCGKASAHQSGGCSECIVEVKTGGKMSVKIKKTKTEKTSTFTVSEELVNILGDCHKLLNERPTAWCDENVMRTWEKRVRSALKLANALMAIEANAEVGSLPDAQTDCICVYDGVEAGRGNCRQCSGMGHITIDNYDSAPEQESCSRCDGTGLCPNCRGDDTADQRQSEAYYALRDERDAYRKRALAAEKKVAEQLTPTLTPSTPPPSPRRVPEVKE